MSKQAEACNLQSLSRHSLILPEVSNLVLMFHRYGETKAVFEECACVNLIQHRLGVRACMLLLHICAFYTDPAQRPMLSPSLVLLQLEEPKTDVELDFLEIALHALDPRC